jgi:hypothetical protein
MHAKSSIDFKKAKCKCIAHLKYSIQALVSVKTSLFPNGPFSFSLNFESRAFQLNESEALAFRERSSLILLRATYFSMESSLSMFKGRPLLFSQMLQTDFSKAEFSFTNGALIAGDLKTTYIRHSVPDRRKQREKSVASLKG